MVFQSMKPVGTSENPNSPQRFTFVCVSLVLAALVSYNVRNLPGVSERDRDIVAVIPGTAGGSC